jgi:hypothetical protein
MKKGINLYNEDRKKGLEKGISILWPVDDEY